VIAGSTGHDGDDVSWVRDDRRVAPCLVLASHGVHRPEGLVIVHVAHEQEVSTLGLRPWNESVKSVDRSMEGKVRSESAVAREHLGASKYERGATTEAGRRQRHCIATHSSALFGHSR